MFFECKDLQARLTATLSLKHEIQFKHIICDLKINPNTPQPCFKNLSIFEKVLVTPGSSEFIDLCISNGSDFFKKNDSNQYPLHYAVTSMCPENIKTLFASVLLTESSNSGQRKMLFSNIVNEKLAGGNNYLHNLVPAMNQESLESFSEIVKLFVTNGCSMNTPNDQLETPFYLLLKKMKTICDPDELVQFVLKNQEIDFFSNKSEQIIKLMKELCLVKEIDKNRIQVRNSDFMLRLLKNRDEGKFIEEFPNFKATTQSVDQFQEAFAEFLKMSAAMNLCKVMKVLLAGGADVNSSVSNSCPPAFVACMFGHFEVLELMLNQKALNLKCDEVNLLHQILTTKHIHRLDRQRCFSLVVNDYRCTMDVINGLDKTGKSPLYYACSNGFGYIARNLLRRGAFIGHPSVVNRMEEKILEKFLDSCIRPSTNLNDTECEIHIDYRFLIPPQNEKPVHCEVESLQKLAESSKLQELLVHPVISSFLQLKWQKIKWIAIVNVVIYMSFLLYLGYFILHYFDSNEFKNAKTQGELKNQTHQCNFSENWNYLQSRFLPSVTTVNITREVTVTPSNQWYTSIFGAKKIFTGAEEAQTRTETIVFHLSKEDLIPFRICMIGSVILAFYELTQCCSSPKKYLFKFSNWLDIALIYLSFNVLLHIPICIDEHDFKMYKAMTILVMSAQTVQSIAKVSIFSLSLHYAIFKKVCLTFFKTISLYLIPILAFAMSFYTLNESDSTSGDKAIKFGFSNIHLSIISTIRMMLADFGAYNFNNDTIFQNSLLVLFIVLITVVLFNLLNALAISDTGRIMKDAELVDIKKRISLLYSYDKMFQFFGIRYGRLFPQMKSFYLKPNIELAEAEKSMKLGQGKRLNGRKLFSVRRPVDRETECRRIHETRFKCSDCTMAKSEFDKILNFVRAKLQ